MPQPKKVYKNSVDQLLSLGIRNVGFEKYDGPLATVEGLRGEDYRWRLTFKNGGKVVNCVTLVEVVKLLMASHPAASI